MKWFEAYPLHIMYLLAYAVTLGFALVTIVWTISREKARWGSLINFFVLLGLVCGMFSLGYYALGGFQNDRETGIIVLVLFAIIGLLFSRNVNSRNAAFLPLILLLCNSGFLMLYRLSLSSSRIVTTEFSKQIIFTVIGFFLLFAVVWFLKILFLLDVHGDRLDMLGLSKVSVVLGRVLHVLFVKRKLSYHIWLILTLILLAIPLFFGAGMGFLDKSYL